MGTSTSPRTPLVDYVERNVRDHADTLAYRFIDYSRERDGGGRTTRPGRSSASGYEPSPRARSR